MDFAYTPEQEELRALARQVLADLATPQRVAEVEATEERIDRDLWRALAGAGLLGVAVPEAFGGGGLGIVELCVLRGASGWAALARWPGWSAGRRSGCARCRSASPTARCA